MKVISILFTLIVALGSAQALSARHENPPLVLATALRGSEEGGAPPVRRHTPRDMEEDWIRSLERTASPTTSPTVYPTNSPTVPPQILLPPLNMDHYFQNMIDYELITEEDAREAGMSTQA